MSADPSIRLWKSARDGDRESLELLLRQHQDLVYRFCRARLPNENRAIDATRVCTFMMDHGQSNRYFDFIPECTGTWHTLSHYRDISGRTEDDDGKISWDTMELKRNMYNRVTQWHHEQFAYLISRLNNLHEPTGQTLLQNTTLCYGSSLSDGHAHGERDLPLIIAGGGGGAFKGGQYLKCRRPTSMSKLHLTLMETMGIELSEFGGEETPLKLG